MTDSTHATILRRMTRTHDTDVAENPLTSSRAVRLALTKAANDAVGLVLSVSSVSDDVDTLDGVLDQLAKDLMLVELHRGGDLLGLIALDMQLRAAVLEIATTGILSSQVVDPRAPTQTDKTLCDPLIAAFIAAFPAAVRGTPFEGWADGIRHENRITDTRAAGLMLADGAYRWVQMDVTLGATDRQGVMIMVLPVAEVAASPDDQPAIPKNQGVWEDDFPRTVMDAPATLTAMLHRLSIPLATARDLQVGSVLPLPGCSVSSVRLLSPDHKTVTEAKLGQSGGMRAVRIEAAPAPDLADLSPTVGESMSPSLIVEEDETPLASAMDMEMPAIDGLGMAVEMDGLAE